ncbi:uncharacterized protein LOC143036572 [Oratosquilla oratoria]|uniref:uncharacterized protein LOC143036572 n=1 Tax=Oratosquilla oratoria TaxID=337810 RepID=UPI003F759421
MHGTTKHFLKAGVQLGPWRITRKVLAFIIAFCVFVIAFGCVVLKYHMFDRKRGGPSDWFSDEDDSSESVDDDDDDDGTFVSGGDVLMLILMVAAGAAMLWSIALCFLSNHSVPDFLESSGDSTIYTIQYEKNPGSTRRNPGQGPNNGGPAAGPGQGSRSPQSAREAMTGRTRAYNISMGAHPQNTYNNNNSTPYAPSHNGPPSPYCPPYYPTPPPSYPSQFYAKAPHTPLGSAPSAPPPPLTPADLPPPYAP